MAIVTPTLDFSDKNLVDEYDCRYGGQKLAKMLLDRNFPSEQSCNVYFGMNFWEGFIEFCEENKVGYEDQKLLRFVKPTGSYRAADLWERLRLLKWG